MLIFTDCSGSYFLTGGPKNCAFTHKYSHMCGQGLTLKQKQTQQLVLCVKPKPQSQLIVKYLIYCNYTSRTMVLSKT